MSNLVRPTGRCGSCWAGGGLGQADIRPELRDGTVRFTLTGAKMFGVAAPKSVTDTIESALAGLTPAGPGVGTGGTGGAAGGTGGGAGATASDRAAEALGLRPTAVTVTEDGLRVDLKGGPAEFDQDIGAAGATGAAGASRVFGAPDGGR
ncbi:hypothetical protein [Streptomyces sp. NPDC002690]